LNIFKFSIQVLYLHFSYFCVIRVMRKYLILVKHAGFLTLADRHIDYTNAHLLHTHAFTNLQQTHLIYKYQLAADTSPTHCRPTHTLATDTLTHSLQTHPPTHCRPTHPLAADTLIDLLQSHPPTCSRHIVCTNTHLLRKHYHRNSSVQIPDQHSGY
jgi:hypothetical protein